MRQLALISHRYRFIALMLAKNASTTLRKYLVTPPCDASEVGYRAVEAEVKQHYFTFAFVRDPVTRFLSAYQEISLRLDSGQQTSDGLDFAAMPEGMDRFRSFLEQAERSLWDPHIVSQSQRLDQVRFDFLGRVETLQEDLAAIFECLGVGELEKLPRRRSREGRARIHGYGQHDMGPEDLDPESLERIRALYSRDIELMNSVTSERYRLPGQTEAEKLADRQAWVQPSLSWVSDSG